MAREDYRWTGKTVHAGVGASDAPRSTAAGRKAGKKTLFGYDGDTVEAGSAAERRHIENLRASIENGQYDFMTYARDMKRVLEPSQQEKEIDAANEDFCRYMLNICLDPLSHGADKDAVLECVGMYVGMSLFSPDFRRTVKAEVGQSLMPAMERRIQRKAEVADFADGCKQHLAAAVESVTGRHFKKFDRLLSPDYVSNRQRADEKIADMRDQVAAASKQGRIPLTPESAACQYLNFGISAYNAMRQPGADQDLIRENYGKAVDTLTRMAREDGIPTEQLLRNVMAVYGKVASKYPEVARCFEETAYGDASRQEGRTVKGSDGREHVVWRGEFDPEKWDGNLSPRVPRNPTEHRDKLTRVVSEGFSGIDSIRGILTAMGSKEMDEVARYYGTMAEEDVGYCDESSWDKDRDSLRINPKTGRPIWTEVAVTDCAKAWKADLDRQGKKPTDEEEFENWRKKQNRHRDASDIPDPEWPGGQQPEY